MDIRSKAVSETSVLHLRDAADEPMFADDGKPMTVTVYGPGSKPYAKAQAAQSNRLIEKMTRNGKFKRTAEEARQDQIELLVACTASMENVTYDELQGEALYRAVYSDASIGFITDQVAKHIGEWGNFTKGSQSS